MEMLFYPYPGIFNDEALFEFQFPNRGLGQAPEFAFRIPYARLRQE